MYYVSIATEDDRTEIYKLRYNVYVDELGQYEENNEKLLYNHLDEVNTYFVIKDELGVIVAFVSCTPPNKYGLSCINHLKNIGISYTGAENAYEVRLLTVLKARGGFFSVILIYMFISWVKYQGGNTIVFLGKSNVVKYYTRCGAYILDDIVLYIGKVKYYFLEASIDNSIEKRKEYFLNIVKNFGSKIEWAGVEHIIKDEIDIITR